MFSCASRSSAASSMVTSRSLLRNVLRQNIQEGGLAGAGAAGDQNADPRLHRGRQHLHHLRRDALQLHQLIGGQRTGAKTADRQRRPIQRQRRNNGIDARAVRQPGVDHRRGLIHSAAHARHDAVDDLQKVAIVAKRRIHSLQQTALFNEHMVFVVHQDVGDLWIPKQGLQRPQTKDLIEQVGLDLFLLVEVQRDSLLGDDLFHDAGYRLARLTRIDSGQFLQIQLGDQGPVYLRFVLFQIQQFHDVPSVGRVSSSTVTPLTLTKVRK